MRINTKAIFAVIIGVLLSITLGFFAFAPMVGDKLKTLIMEESKNAINGEFTLKDVKLVWLNKVQLNGVQITKDGNIVADIPKLNLSIALWNVLATNKLELVESLTVYEPTVNLVMDANKRWNIVDLLKPSPESQNKFVSLVNLRDAKLNIDLNGQKLSIVANGSVDARSGDENYALDVVADAQDIGALKVVGLVNANRQGRMNISAQQLTLEPLQNMLGEYVTVEQLKGSVTNVDIIWQDQKGKKLLNGKFEAQNVKIVYPYEKKKFDLNVTGPVTFKDSEINFKQVQVTINGQAISLDGGVVGKNNSWLPDNLKIGIKKAELGKLLSEKYVQGLVDAEAVFKTDNDQLSFEGEVKSDKIKFKEYEFSKINIPFKFKDNKLYIDGAKVDALNGKLSAKAVYNAIEKRYNLEIDAQALNLSELRVDDLSGTAKAKLVATGKVDQEKRDFDLAGTLTLNTLNYKDMAFNEIVADVSKIGQEIAINNGVAGLENMGKVAFFGSLKQEEIADIYLTTSNMPLRFIMQPLGISSTGTVNMNLHFAGNLNNPTVQATLNTADKGSIAGLKYNSLQADIVSSNNIWQIKDLSMNTSKILDTKDGQYKMFGTVDMQSGTPILDINIDTKNVRADDVMRENFDMDVTGYFNSRINVKGAITSPEVLARATLYEGSINGFAIHYLHGELSYKDGLLNAPNIILDSLTKLKVRASGFMQNEELNFDVVAKDLPLESIPRLSGFDAKGNISFDGKITGRLNRPQFMGFINSQSLSVYNQEFTDLIGKISSDAGITTEVMVDFKEAKGGEFYFSGGLDYAQHYAYGKFLVNKANIEPFLAMSNEDYSVKGLLDGEIYLNRNGKGSGTEIVGRLSQASVADLPIQEAEVNVFITRERFLINKFQATQGEGTLNAFGYADFRGNANISVDGQNLNAQLLAVGRKKGLRINGLMNINASITGETLKPNVTADINILNGGLGDSNFDSLSGQIAIHDNTWMDIKSLTLSKMGFKSTLSGSIPLVLFKDKQNREGAYQEMDLRLKTEDANLGVLAAISSVNYSSGSLFGDLRITGTIEEPKIYGDLRVQNGVVKLDAFKNPLSDITLDLNFNGQYINLKEASAKMGKGSLNFGGNLNIAKDQTETYNLWGKADNVDLESLYIKGLLNGDFSLAPQPNRNRPMLKANVNLANITFLVPGIPDFNSSEAIKMGLDINLNLGKNVRVVSKSFCDLYLKGGLQIRGSAGFPNINGNIEVDRGTITYLRTPFKVEKAVISYPLPGTYLPNVNIEAVTRLLQYDITLQARGPITNMELLLSSNPPRSQQELFRLLTLKVESNSSEVNSADAKGLLVTGLQMSIFGDVEYELRSRLGLNEFRIYQGNINTGTALDMVGKQTIRSKNIDTTYNVLVSKYFTDKLLLGYSTAVDFKNYVFYAQYFISRSFNISVGMDEVRKKKFALEYKVTF